MNKFELKLLQRELVDFNLINAFYTPCSKGIYELFAIFKHNDVVFCSHFTGLFDGHIEHFNHPYSNSKQVLETIIKNDIQTINNISQDTADPDTRNRSFVVSRFVNNLISSLLHLKAIDHADDIGTSNIMSYAFALENNNNSFIDIYKSCIERYAMDYLKLDNLDLNSLNIIKEED